MKERIDTILVKKGYFTTRQKAKYAIQTKCVYVENKLIEKPGKLVEEDSKIEIKGQILPFVSRGGLKLAKAIEVFRINLEEKIAMDIGASTGGFTDCMIQNGAKKVYAIDVGHEQLDNTLKENEHIKNMEGTDIRKISKEEVEEMDFIATDVSFISLTQILDKAYEFLKIQGEMVALIKPQFEAGREEVNKSGIVKHKKVHQKVIEKIVLYANSLGFSIQAIDYSPIKGAAGNIEYLIFFKKEKEKQNFNLFLFRETIKQIVEKAQKELKE